MKTVKPRYKIVRELSAHSAQVVVQSLCEEALSKQREYGPVKLFDLREQIGNTCVLVLPKAGFKSVAMILLTSPALDSKDREMANKMFQEFTRELVDGDLRKNEAFVERTIGDESAFLNVLSKGLTHLGRSNVHVYERLH